MIKELKDREVAKIPWTITDLLFSSNLFIPINIITKEYTLTLIAHDESRPIVFSKSKLHPGTKIEWWREIKS